MKEKEYLISLIDRFLDSRKDNDTTFFREVLSKIRINPDYIYDFINGLSEDLISDIASGDKKFIDEINDLKIAIINKKYKSEDKYNGIITHFKEVLYEKSYLPYEERAKRLKDKLLNNRYINYFDYNFVQRLVYLLETENVDLKYNQLMNYLNKYNAPLINHLKRKPKKEVNYTLVGDTSISDNNQINKTKESKEKNENISLFEHVEFDYIPKERSRKNRKRRIENKVSKELNQNNINESLANLFDDIGFSYNSFKEQHKQELEKMDYNLITKKLDLLKEKNLIRFIKNNHYKCLFLLITKLDIDKVEIIIKDLKEIYGLSDDSISVILSGHPTAFSSEGYRELVLNIENLQNIGFENINDFAKRSKQKYFYEKAAINTGKIETIKSYGLDPKSILGENFPLFSSCYPTFIKNIRILNTYGYDLTDEEDYKSFSILGNVNLSNYLDSFIEMGFNNYIHNNPQTTLTALKALVIKKIYYSWKNNEELFIPSTGNINDAQNKKYEELIKKRSILTENEISSLIAEHPILEIIEEGHRINIFDDSYYASIKRKTEFIFDNIIISRPKTYSIFSALIEKNIKDEDALLYALCYHKSLTNDEYMIIKSCIYPKSKGDKII